MSASPAPTVDYAPAPAGWYPDPACHGGRRYWDGKSWTQETTEPVAAAAPAPARTSRASVGLTVFGYLSALLIPILGLILGAVVAKRHEGTGTNHGAFIIGLAIASFVVNAAILSSLSA